MYPAEMKAIRIEEDLNDAIQSINEKRRIIEFLYYKGELHALTVRKAESVFTMAKKAKAEAAKYYGIEEHLLSHKTRDKDVVLARFVAMWIIYKLSTPKKGETRVMTLAKIGKEFGDRDHATALHAINKIDMYIETNQLSRGEIDEIISMI